MKKAPEKLFENGPEWEQCDCDTEWAVVIGDVEYSVFCSSTGHWYVKEESWQYFDNAELEVVIDWIRKRVRARAAELVGIVGTEWSDTSECKLQSGDHIISTWYACIEVDSYSETVGWGNKSGHFEVLTVAGEPVTLP